MPAADSQVSSPRSLARSIQIAAFAMGALCAGCQSVDYSQPRLDRSPRPIAGLAYTGDDAQAASGPVATISDLPAYNGDDVWQRVAQRCRLVDRQGMNERIVSQRDWLLKNRGFVTGASARASPYLHFIVERLDERNLPMELALLPMIESAYNPMASSPRAAAGLWQFIPSSGRDYNLHQSATYDARRDVVASSKAAMDYLTRLHAQFDNDWLLALAAYNAGEGTVGRAIEANRRRGLPLDYWHLSLPKETQDYVPRLLALSLLVRNPGAYGVQFTPVANTAYFDVVELNHAVDLTQLAAMAGVDEGQFLRLNSAFLGKKTLDGPGRLLIPKTQHQVLTAGIARMTGESPITAVLAQHPATRPVAPAPSPVALQAPTPMQGGQPAPVAEPRLPAEPVAPAVVASTPDASASTPPIAASTPPVAASTTPVTVAIQNARIRDDSALPRKRDESEYRSRAIASSDSPRVVMYAAEPSQ